MLKFMLNLYFYNKIKDMKHILMIFFMVFAGFNLLKGQDSNKTTIPHEENKTGESPAYKDVIAFYQNLDLNYSTIKLMEIGTTDAGYPLHIIVFNPEATFDLKKLKHTKATLLINNGIHPGEPDGIDATMTLFKELAEGKMNAPKNTLIAAIAVYNIGGALNRNSTSRVNQNGPSAYGFRGNARNYDLNRDFIKTDSRNTEAFAELFHMLNPDVFIDNHVSNGADYQYTLTHLFTQHNKMGGDTGNYLHTFLIPALEKSLSEKNWDITPYVNVFNSPPEKGFTQFMDYPRYSTGYAALFDTFGLMIETHMLKPYKNRVEGTYEIMKSMIEITDKNYQQIKDLRKNAYLQYKTRDLYPVQWKIDSSKVTTLQFKGYESSYKKSNVTGKDRLFYDREKPFIKPVSYYNHFKPTSHITIPKAYIIPKGWWNIIHLLEINNIKMNPIEKDTVITVEVYRMEKFETRTTPFEGHYLHYNTTISKTTEELNVSEGDYIVHTNQPGVKYLLETLEPESVDSFFNWNFFDTILQQKEGFSPYVFEEIAEDLLLKNPKIKIEFESKKAIDVTFKENWYAQLDWLYKKSPHYEKAHMRYPIYRIMN